MNENSIHPIEGRYKTEQMAKIFTQSAKLARWLRVESALAQAHAFVGNIPKKLQMKFLKSNFRICKNFQSFEHRT